MKRVNGCIGESICSYEEKKCKMELIWNAWQDERPEASITVHYF